MSEETALCILLMLLVLALLQRQWIWEPVLVTGKSMLPTLHSGQFRVVNKLAYRHKAPQRGDIVAVWTGKDLIIKRVVGLPGEELSAQGGTFYVNGQALEEKYVEFHAFWNVASATVDRDEFVVSGDNRSETLVAVVKRNRIVGKVIQ